MSESRAIRAAREGGLLQGPLVALEFLTVLRLRGATVVEDRVFGASQAWFPLVGLGLGATLYGVSVLTEGVLSATVVGWLMVAVLALMTGGLHIDGLADTVDGMYGGQNREET